MTDTNRVALTVRMRPDDKAVFVQAAGKSGLEPGIAARTLLELMAKRLREDDDFLEALLEIKQAWKNRKVA